MNDEMTTPPSDEPTHMLDAEEARENARQLEEQRRQLIEERWLATHVLAIHLEIESMLGTMLRQTLPRPERFLDRAGMEPTFAQKLRLCEALDLLSYQEFLAHFDTIGRSELDGLLFVSLRLLRANFAVMFTDEPPEPQDISASEPAN
jgi:hypothetical protein